MEYKEAAKAAKEAQRIARKAQKHCGCTCAPTVVSPGENGLEIQVPSCDLHLHILSAVAVILAARGVRLSEAVQIADACPPNAAASGWVH